MAKGVGGGSPANVAKYLKGIDFPASKKDLINHAKKIMPMNRFCRN